MPTTLPYAILAFGLSLMLHLLVWKLFPRFGLLDRPAKYGLTRAPLPYPVGIASIAAFIIMFMIARQEISFQDGGLLLSIILVAIMAFIDDRLELPAWVRLLMQIIIGFLLFATGTRIYTITNPLGGIVKLDLIDIPSEFFGPLPLWSGIFTMLWVILTMNAFNWFDGIPGQVSILSVIGAFTIGFLALSERVNQPDIAAMAFMLGGIALAGAFFDFPPNKVVMGDTGAMFFGLMLGTLSIYAGGKVATAFLVLGLPLIDSICVAFTRILRGRSPLRGDLDHLHHRLLKKEWSKRRIIALTVLLGTAFGVTALFLSTFQKFLAILLLFGAILLLRRFARETA